MILRQVRAGNDPKPLLENELDLPPVAVWGSRETLDDHLIARGVAGPVLDLAEGTDRLGEICRRLVYQAISEGLAAEEIVSFFSGREVEPCFLSVAGLAEEFSDAFAATKIGDPVRSQKKHLSRRISRLIALAEDGSTVIKAKDRVSLLRETAEKAKKNLEKS